MRVLLSASVLLVLAAGAAHAADVPTLDTGPSCRDAVASAVFSGRSEDACNRDEQVAKDEVHRQWASFNGSQQSHCVKLSTLGGPPSYVELLTCLEMGKAAAELPKGARASDSIAPAQR